jgi:hypothetical protein
MALYKNLEGVEVSPFRRRNEHLVRVVYRCVSQIPPNQALRNIRP